MSDLDKKFLVHIVLSGEVLGPFSRKELIQQIKKGEISGSDEVTGPFSFWRRLQDHPEFRETALNFKTRFNRIVTQLSSKLSISKTPVTSSMKNAKTLTDTINAKTMTDSQNMSSSSKEEAEETTEQKKSTKKEEEDEPHQDLQKKEVNIKNFKKSASPVVRKIKNLKTSKEVSEPETVKVKGKKFIQDNKESLGLVLRFLAIGGLLVSFLILFIWIFDRFFE